MRRLGPILKSSSREEGSGQKSAFGLAVGPTGLVEMGVRGKEKSRRTPEF